MLRRAFPDDLDGPGFQRVEIVSRPPFGLGSGKDCNIAAAAVIGMLYSPFTVAGLILDHGHRGVEVVRLGASICERLGAFPPLALRGIFGRQQLLECSRSVCHDDSIF
jgi:hypothetical protein